MQGDDPQVALSAGFQHDSMLINFDMNATVIVGVLALQGAFIEHVQLLKQAAKQVVLESRRTWEVIEVRTPQELARCDALIIPGGESTTIALAAVRSGLLEPLRRFVKYVPVSLISSSLV